MIAIYKNGKLDVSSSVNTNQYTGEKTGGEFRNWKLFGTDPNEFVSCSYGILSSRNATLYSTSSLARACVNKPLNYSIGTGLVFKSLPNADFLEMEEEDAKAWGRKFTELLHFEKTLVNYYEKQSIIVREAKITGDAVVFLYRDKKMKRPFDIIVSPGDGIDWEKNETGKYKLGIRMDKFSRRKGFWSSTANRYVSFQDKNQNQNAIQFLFKERAGQARGNGVFYSAIGLSKNLDRVYDATIERMVQEAIQMGYFEATNTDVVGQARGLAKASVSRSDTSGKDGSLTEINPDSQALKPGGMYVLQNGEKMNFNDMKAPGNNFGMANEWILKHFAMATGIPPEVILSEYSTSYTAHKGALNDFIKAFMKDRKTFISIVDSKINLEYLKHFARTGQIEVHPGFWDDERIQLAYLEGVHLGPIPGQINPLQEVNADIKASENGFTLKSSIATKYGNDFWNMIGPWEEEQKRWFEASPEKQAELLSKNPEPTPETKPVPTKNDDEGKKV